MMMIMRASYLYMLATVRTDAALLSTAAPECHIAYHKDISPSYIIY